MVTTLATMPPLESSTSNIVAGDAPLLCYHEPRDLQARTEILRDCHPSWRKGIVSVLLKSVHLTTVIGPRGEIIYIIDAH